MTLKTGPGSKHMAPPSWEHWEGHGRVMTWVLTRVVRMFNTRPILWIPLPPSHKSPFIHSQIWTPLKLPCDQHVANHHPDVPCQFGMSYIDYEYIDSGSLHLGDSTVCLNRRVSSIGSSHGT